MVAVDRPVSNRRYRTGSASSRFAGRSEHVGVGWKLLACGLQIAAGACARVL